MAGRQRERFRERDRRRDNNRHSKEYDYYERRSNSYSSDDEDRDRDSYSSSKDNYNQNNNNYRRRYSNDRRQDDNWQDQQRNDRRSSNRNERYRSRSRERDQQQQYNRKQRDSQGDRFDNDGVEQYNDKRNREEVAPNNTIMLRNLGLQINENEIMSKLAEIGLKPKEIRLMRKKDTGESRGFAFVEFNDVNEAIYWKNQNQGHITFSDGQESSLHFSIPKESFNQDRNQLKTDWTCYKCGVVNFKRRDVCFKCATTREESTANETGDEISSVPTNCLLFRNLNPYTTEERILTILGTFSDLPIKSIKIPKENSVSLCVCFVELYTTQEAAQIYALLSALTSGFIIDDYLITISYAKRNVPNSNGMNTTGLKNAASMALAAAQWTNQSTSETATSSNEQSSSHQFNSTTSSAKQQNEQKSSSNLPHSSKNVQIVIPFNAPVLNNDYGQVTINNQIYRKYPLPDASTYVLEETSGYYYDSLTCLYYDPNSHYYYNGQTQKYMYWSNDYQTYLPVDTDLSKNQSNKNETEDKKEASNGTSSNDLKDGDKDKNDKVKTAKKIMKEMDKWTKQLNQKNKEALNKQISSTNSNQDDLNQLNSSSSKIGLNSISVGNSGISLNINSVKEVSKPKLIENNPLFETFNDNDVNNDQNTKSSKDDNILDKKLSNDRSSSTNIKPSIDKSTIQTLNLTDWNKLICLLCKRQFASKEQLGKHQQASELHKTNLYKLTGFNFTQEQIAELSKNDGEFNFNYRDRAKERREKYGQDDKPEVPSSRYKEKYMRGIKNVLGKQDDYTSNFETPNQSAQLQNSIGAKFLKKFGWDDGQGLGKSNQGRSSLIEMERRTAGVGLGIKTTHPSGESYKDAVKRTMLERYKRLHEEELASKMQNQ